MLLVKTLTRKRDLPTVKDVKGFVPTSGAFYFWPTTNMRTAARVFVFVLALSLTPAVQQSVMDITVPEGGYSRSGAEDLAGRKCAHRVSRCLRLFYSFCAVILL